MPVASSQVSNKCLIIPFGIVRLFTVIAFTPPPMLKRRYSSSLKVILLTFTPVGGIQQNMALLPCLSTRLEGKMWILSFGLNPARQSKVTVQSDEELFRISCIIPWYVLGFLKGEQKLYCCTDRDTKNKGDSEMPLLSLHPCSLRWIKAEWQTVLWSDQSKLSDFCFLFWK